MATEGQSKQRKVVVEPTPVEAGDASPGERLPDAPKGGLKKLPGYSRGVRMNAALRMKKLAYPICPLSKNNDVRRDSQGNLVKTTRPPEADCARRFGDAWYLECEKLGHDPYFREYRWIEAEDVIEVDDDGREVLRGIREIVMRDKLPNVKQVAIAPNINNGLGVRMAKKQGAKPLHEVGFEAPCEFRNCQEEVDTRFVSASVGRYCSLIHLQLIAARHQEIFLTDVGASFYEEGEEAKVSRKRAAQLRESVQGFRFGG